MDDDETTATRKKKSDGTIVGTSVTADVSVWAAMLALLPTSIGNPAISALVSALKTQNS